MNDEFKPESWSLTVYPTLIKAESEDGGTCADFNSAAQIDTIRTVARRHGLKEEPLSPTRLLFTGQERALKDAYLHMRSVASQVILTAPFNAKTEAAVEAEAETAEYDVYNIPICNLDEDADPEKLEFATFFPFSVKEHETIVFSPDPDGVYAMLMQGIEERDARLELFKKNFIIFAEENGVGYIEDLPDKFTLAGTKEQISHVMDEFGPLYYHTLLPYETYMREIVEHPPTSIDIHSIAARNKNKGIVPS